MSGDFKDIDRRLKHVHNQINTLEAQARGFAPKLKDHRLVVQSNSETSQECQVRFTWSVPETWGFAVGEVAHHLRSILDNAIWQIVLANNKEPVRANEYPIARDVEWFDTKGLRKLEGVSDPAIALIRQLQPYSRPDIAYKRHPLWIVHEMDIIDKHQIVHVAAVVPESSAYDVAQAHIDAGVVVTLHYRPLQDGTPIMEFAFERPCDVPVKMKGKATLQIKILETERTPYLDFPDFLSQGHSTIVQIIDRLRPFVA
jgi:hypothetical protein